MIFLPSRPIILPFNSSEGIGAVVVVISATWEEAYFCITCVIKSRAFFSMFSSPSFSSFANLSAKAFLFSSSINCSKIFLACSLLRLAIFSNRFISSFFASSVSRRIFLISSAFFSKMLLPLSKSSIFLSRFSSRFSIRCSIFIIWSSLFFSFFLASSRISTALFLALRAISRASFFASSIILATFPSAVESCLLAIVCLAKYPRIDPADKDKITAAKTAKLISIILMFCQIRQS